MAPQHRSAKTASRRELRRELRQQRAASSSAPSQQRASHDAGSCNGPSACEQPDESVWAPSSYTVFKALLSVRLCAAVWNNIQDCDETFNYWEPLHHLLYGRGLQTWEYAPQYALRSYAYIALHAAPARLYALLLQSNRLLVFYFVRCVLALCCVACEVCLYGALRARLGAHVARLTLLILAASAGMFVASSALLPSSFCMYCSMLIVAAWLRHSVAGVVLISAVSAIVGWPFAALIGLPIAADILLRQGQWVSFIKWSLIALLVVAVPTLRIDSYFYGRLVFPSANIVLYNVFSASGANLYGTEPPSFYALNLLLNFNWASLAAVCSLPAVMLARGVGCVPSNRQTVPSAVLLTPMYLWLVVFGAQAHKEERFMFPVFPLLCVAAAVCVDAVQRTWRRVHAVSADRLCNRLLAAALLAFCVASASRVVGQYRGFHAPLDTFMQLNRLAGEHMRPSADRPLFVCVGREWHRFPSSFFMPRLSWRLAFVRSQFDGQLPQYYRQDVANPTSAAVIGFNDANREQPERFVPAGDCHLLVDVDSDRGGPLEPNYSADTHNWTVVHSTPFLDVARCSRLLRAFYVPVLTDRYCGYMSYNLLVNRRYQKMLFGKL